VLQRCGFNVHFRNFKIQNLVASTDVGGLLMLDEMASAFGTSCSYEPDMFPGLVLRIVNPKVVYLCFRSGKIVITGARNRDMITSTFTEVYREIMCKFIDTRSTASNSADYRHECAHRNSLL
jgi:transcription initiation factor TFIID TATA-box-binding protein